MSAALCNLMLHGPIHETYVELAPIRTNSLWDRVRRVWERVSTFLVDCWEVFTASVTAAVSGGWEWLTGCCRPKATIGDEVRKGIAHLRLNAHGYFPAKIAVVTKGDDPSPSFFVGTFSPGHEGATCFAATGSAAGQVPKEVRVLLREDLPDGRFGFQHYWYSESGERVGSTGPGKVNHQTLTHRVQACCRKFPPEMKDSLERYFLS